MPHVLIVEDSRTQALRMQLELQRHGIQSMVATTGPQGLQAARTQQPDLIVLDIDLPELDGYSVCRALKADPATAHIPVVMLTQHDETEHTVIGLELGAVDYIPKDVFAEQNVLAAIRHLGIL